MERQQGIGLAIGDDLAAAAGRSSDGSDWLMLQPALVCAPSAAASVELLLAGDEARSAGQATLLHRPRSLGYQGTDPESVRELLTALLVTLRQSAAPGGVKQPAGQTVLVVPHTVSTDAAANLLAAAVAAGWPSPRPVSELAALAAARLDWSQGTEPVTVAVRQGELVHEAAFALHWESDRVTLVAAKLRSYPAAEAGAVPQPEAAELARGGALIARHDAAVRLDPSVSVWLGLTAAGGGLVPLFAGLQAGWQMRAIDPPGPEGVLLQLAVWYQPDGLGRQLVAELYLEGGQASASREPWLVEVALAADAAGELTVLTAEGRRLGRAPFAVRLP